MIDKTKREKIVPCICAAIVDDGKILLIHRNKAPYKGYWAMVGGKIEFGEHVEDTAVREAKEETGIDCQVLAIKGIASEIVHTQEGADEHYIIYVILLKPGTLEFTESDEGKLEWFDLHEIDNVQPIAPSDLIMIKEFVLKDNEMKVHQINVKKNGAVYDVEEFL